MSIIEDAYAKFCFERFGMATEQQLVLCERRCGITFPDDYRRYVLAYNGGYFNEPDFESPDEDCPADALTYMHGIGASHPTAELATQRLRAIFTGNDPPEFIPIGYTIMGYFVVILTRPEDRGTIFLKTFDDFFFLASDVESFFGLLHEPTGD